MNFFSFFKNTLAWLSMTVFFSAYVGADIVANLHEVIVPVANQGDKERLKAMSIGLESILVKITGESQPLKGLVHPSPESFVADFSYVGYVDPLQIKSANSGLGISFNYDPSEVGKLIQKYRLKIWPADRHFLLAWIVIEDPVEGIRFMTQKEFPEATEALRRLMDNRGAPLVFPLLDLKDTKNFFEVDVWNLDQKKLSIASDRYTAKYWVAVRLFQGSSGQWNASWDFSANNSIELKHTMANSLPKLFDEIVPHIVDTMASRYSYIPKENTEKIVLQLQNINDYASLREAISYLESLEMVRDLRVKIIDQDRVSLELHTGGEELLLLETFRRDRRIKENVNNFKGPILVDIEKRGATFLPKPQLQFIWQGR